MKALCVVLFSLCYLVCSQPDCSKIPAGPGRFINLSAIVGVELTLKDSYSTYTATICKNTYASCGSTPSCGGPAGYCQRTDFWADCIGVFTSLIVGPDYVELLYTKGDWGNEGRIRLICDPKENNVSVPSGGNNYKFMNATSKYACPVSICDASSCRNCSALGCSWCLDNSACGDRNTTTSCRNFINNPSYCPVACGDFKTCNTCVTRDTCAWCIHHECVSSNDVDKCPDGAVRDPKYCNLEPLNP